MEDISYKKLTAEDWQQFQKIRLIFLKNEPQAAFTTHAVASKLSQQDFEDDLNNPEHIYWGAIYENEIVSIAGVHKENSKWILKSVYTLVKARGNKIMQQMISNVIASITELDPTSEIWLKVTTTQTAAIKVYTNLGFNIHEVLHHQKLGDGNFYDMYKMRYTLDK